VDDTSILCCKSNSNELVIALKEILESINVWFSINSLTLNLTKTNCVQFLSKRNSPINININHGDTQINNTITLKFLGLTMDSTLLWKEHIKHTASKLSSASYAIRILTSIMSLERLLMTYYAYAHSIMSYGIVFWGNSIHSDQIFKIKKRIVRIIMKVGNRDSCRPLFKSLNILPFYSQHIFSISIFVVKNLDKFVTNSDIHGVHTRQGSDLRYPTCELTKVQKGLSFTGIGIFNNLPLSIKNLSEDINKFKCSLKKILQVGSFYPLDEYYE
jgi:hypothetical protein